MCDLLKKEFYVRNFLLDIPKADAFASSEWLSPRMFIVYRLLLALYTTAWSVIGVISREEQGFKWFIFLTNWSYTFVNVHFILGAGIALYYHFFDKMRSQLLSGEENIVETNGGEGKTSNTLLLVSCKASWVIYNIAANVALPVTVMYWSVVYKPRQHIDGSTVNAHALNSFLVIVDTMLCCIPIRLLHVVYPMIYSVIYTIFSIIYWICGGTNPDTKPYIYAALDYGDHPRKAAVFVCLFIFVANPLSRLFLFGLYWLRVWLRRSLGGVVYLREV